MFISTYCNVKKHLLWCNVWMHRLQGWLRKSKMLKSQSWPAILQYCRTLNVMFVPGRGFICKTLTWYCLKNKFARFATMSHHLVADGRPLQLHVDRKKKKKSLKVLVSVWMSENQSWLLHICKPAECVPCHWALTCCWNVEGNWRTQRKSTHGENMKNPQETDSGQKSDGGNTTLLWQAQVLQQI